MMNVNAVTLEGTRVRLEPMRRDHLEALAAVAFHPAVWRWMPSVVQNEAELLTWIEQALEQQTRGWALPWVTWSKDENRIVGATRFMDINAQHHGLEIGSTWVTPSCQRSGVNVEAKYLQLQYAFEDLGAVRVAFKTHHNNTQSQTAIAALGAKQEGVFRNHMIMPDGSLRHTVWYSITREDWPEAKVRLEKRMQAAAQASH
jgi:N-acetyltransferase